MLLRDCRGKAVTSSSQNIKHHPQALRPALKISHDKLLHEGRYAVEVLGKEWKANLQSSFKIRSNHTPSNPAVETNASTFTSPLPATVFKNIH
jgi:hypothetical protein